ncbi:tetratricopeptide repeat protein [Oleidesulfovibrio sp.]|uniref:tetratricopeptide repeat protein n=1 Tax=Oleidesulfovibrio sp. TaxID=2909707 RepID=UPI003A882968
MSNNAKVIKENLARAKSYFNRHDVQRAVAATATAVQAWVKGGEPSLGKVELQGALREVVSLLSRADEVSAELGGPLVWQPGQEKVLLVQLANVLRALQHQDLGEDHRKILERKLKLDKLFNYGCRLLENHKVKEADEAFQEAMTHHKDEDVIFRMMGERMMAASQPAMALRYLKRSLKAAPERSVVEMTIDAYKRSGNHGSAVKLQQKYADLLK